ncbi:MAG: AMP-binding protein [Pseudomonadota bacterium]
MSQNVPTAEQSVLRYVLDHWADVQSDTTFACFEDGSTWNYAETHTRTRKLAAALQSIGVRQGDHVVVWLPNSKDALVSFFAINYIGAVFVPINVAYRGPLLEHVIAVSDAKVMIAHGLLVDRLGDVNHGLLETLVVAGEDDGQIEGLEHLDFEGIQANAGAPSDPEQPIEPWHTQSIIFTSGTTGPSKGALSTYIHAYVSMNDQSWYCVNQEDRYLINMPFFHIGGSFILYSMLCRGASITLTETFRTKSFWPTVRATGSTVVFLLGTMASFLMKEPETDEDRNHPLKKAFIVPIMPDLTAFTERFGVEIYTIFNMTEISSPIISKIDQVDAGFCGKPRQGYQLRVVDDNDLEVPGDQVGELIMRADLPWSLSTAYYKNPEATAKTWRNGWFHTGDAFRKDSDGNFYFVDRLKDAIRRRGENISSAEVEAVVMEHEAVRECAAVAAPSEWGEDEVLLVLALKDGEQLAPESLLDYLRPRMAHFMLPRYIRFMAELPKTPTAKIQKAELRNEGLTDDTWDREEAGVKVTGERFS